MNNKLEEIILQSGDFKEFEAKARRGDFPKTVMLISKDNDYAFEFAKFLSCLVFDGEMSKGENYLKVTAGAHPDLKVYPSKDRLVVADSQEIVFESTVKPIFANKKVFIIKDIDKALEGAQNKLLKTLEEPNKNVHFILTASNSNLVLPTIRSRCVKIELKKIGLKQLEGFIEGENSSLACALSDGFVGKAIWLNDKKELKPLFESVIAIVTKLKSSKDMLPYSKTILSFNESSDLVLSILSLIMEDLLYIKSGKEDGVRLKEYLDLLKSVEREYSVKAIVEIRALIDKAVKETMFNCSLVVVLENLILNILEVKYLCR